MAAAKTKKKRKPETRRNRKIVRKPVLRRAQMNWTQPKRRHVFAMEYARDLNAKAAAIRAGYAPKKAADCGYQMLRDPEVQQIIQDAIDARRAHCLLQTESTLENLAAIANSDIRDVATILTGQPAEALQLLPAHVTVTIKAIELFEDGRIRRLAFWDKMAAVQLAVRYLQLIKDSREKPMDGLDVGSMTVEQIDRKLAEIYERTKARSLMPSVVEGSVVPDPPPSEG